MSDDRRAARADAGNAPRYGCLTSDLDLKRQPVRDDLRTRIAIERVERLFNRREGAHHPISLECRKQALSDLRHKGGGSRFVREGDRISFRRSDGQR